MSDVPYDNIYDEKEEHDESITETEKKRLENMKNDADHLPNCAERILMQLLVRIEHLSNSGNKTIDMAAEILPILSTLENQLTAERRTAAELLNDLKKVRLAINNGDLRKTSHGLSKILKAIQPLDVAEIRRLVAKGGDGAKRVYGQAIVLLVGATGVGKSTTIQFVAGCQMEKTKVPIESTFLEHIAPTGPLPQPDLVDITSSPFARSETRFIVPVEIPLGDIYNDHRQGSIILCDAPGFGDTAGAEVDIANGVVLKEALNSCESIKILALSSFEGKGDRGEGIGQLTHILSNLILDIEEHSDAFVYGFTKYPPKSDPLADLITIQKSLTKSRNDAAFEYILNDMIAKSRKKALKIYPIAGDRKQLVDKLSRATEILMPAEKFQLSMSKETWSTIDDYIHKAKEAISYAIDDLNFPIVLYQLDNLQTLVNLIKLNSVQGAYDGCVQIVADKMHGEFKKAKEKLSRALVGVRGLKQKDIDQYKTAIQMFENAGALKQHLNSKIIESAALTEFVTSEVKRLRNMFEKEELYSERCHVYLKAIAMLKEVFAEINAEYEICCKHIAERFQRTIGEAKNNISASEFDNLADNIRNLFLSKSLVSQYLPPGNDLINSSQQVTDMLLKHLNEYFDDSTAVVQQGTLQHGDLTKLTECEKILKSAKDNSLLVNVLSQSSNSYECLNEIYANFITKLVNYIEHLSSKIRQNLEDGQCTLSDIEALVEEIKLLRTIQEVGNRTADIYYQTKGNINEKVQQITRNWEELVPSVDNLLDSKNHPKLIRFLSQLKNLDWVKQLNPSAYTALEQVRNEVLDQIENLQATLVLNLDRSKKHPEKLTEVNELLRQINTWSNLGKAVPFIVQAANKVSKQCFEMINTTLQQFKSNYSLKETRLMHDELEKLDEIKRTYICMQKQNEALEKSDNETSDAEGIENAPNQLGGADSASSSDRQQNAQKKPTEKPKYNVRQQSAGFLNDQTKSTTTAVDKRDNEQYFDAESFPTDSNSYLESQGFRSIQALNDSARTKQNKIAQLKDAGQEFYFDKLNVSEIEFALEFTLHCEESLLPQIRQEAKVISDCLYKYLKEYGVFVDREVDYNMQYLSNQGLCNDMDLKQADMQKRANQVALRFQEMKNLSKSLTVFKNINGEDSLQKWKNSTQTLLANLRDQAHDDYMSGNDKLSNRLLVARASLGFESYADIAFSDGFGALCQKYQERLSDECKEIYKKVIGSINECDFERAAFELAQVDEKGVAPKFMAQIRNDLNCSLIKLIKDTRSKAVWLNGRWEEENLTQDIHFITENVDKIRKACNKKAITTNLDSDTEQMLFSDGKFKFMEELDDILSQGLLKLLEKAEYSIDNNGFLEAETIIDRFSRLQQSLDNLGCSPALLNKYNQLKNSLDKIADLILEKNDFYDYENYLKNSPKALMEKLKSVAERRVKYQQVYSMMLQKIENTLNDVLSEVRKTSYDERQKKMSQLITACRFLPDELRNDFKEKIDIIKEEFKNSDDITMRKVQNIVDNDKGDVLSIKRIHDFMQNLHDNHLLKHTEKLSELVVQKVSEIHQRFGTYLDEQQWHHAIKEIKSIHLYSSMLGNYISKLEVLLQYATESFAEAFKKLLRVLQTACYQNYSYSTETVILNVIISLAIIDDEKLDDKQKHLTLIDNQIYDYAINALKNFSNYLKSISEKYLAAIQDKNVYQLEQTIPILRQWSTFLDKTATITSENQILNALITDLKTIPTNDKITFGLSAMIRKVKDSLTVDLMNSDTIQYEDRRDAFFRELAKSYIFLTEVRNLLEKVLPNAHDVETVQNECLKAIRMQLDKLGKVLIEFSEIERPSRDHCDSFRSAYHHLASFNKHFRPLAITTDYIEEATKKLHSRIADLRNQMDIEKWNTTVVAQNLINMKFLADNLFMFQETINNDINSCLQSYKAKNGADMIFKLCMSLEEDEIGTKLISDHACLKGEDWRKRREKMQHQDNVEYVLEDLKGDNISFSNLQQRFKLFREIYDELIKVNLPSMETNASNRLDSLSLKAKMIVGKYCRPGEGWKASFMDHLPELLAHIFAIWTLQSTEYYNASRGIASNQSYLLMPHCAQVIAILRILGTGYEEKASSKMDTVTSWFRGKNLSSKLINNLVQIGTGEGKSVVMAVVASVFALTGVHVSCSCYSDYLSKRDQEAFSSLFQTLKIADRIEYGTFNKLCENLLNSQCNVREKVKQIIMKNEKKLQQMLSFDKTRPQVLLIDEVDVFLSEKFYGGLYTPSVILNDESIKNLLRVVWKAKPKNLQYVKNTKEYKECTNKFSNWTVLIDEAIKDALLSLRSFKSSTHIVDCDRIKYVEGDSVAENVLLGYDTVWAYYYEHDNGNISEASLANNVGFIVNCGTFSYAEMPLDFAYISGVTGTLQTLANVEKEILRNIYGIERYTYMPSVFGKCNRNYNPISDVHVINKAEYLMRLRGEIDVMRNAKRAVLMFFESEERLNEFYNSSELSSIKKHVQLITERISAADRELYVNRAATEGQVTLLTRTYGRGTDFICRNQQLLANGGLHVVQTFFSEELSEEYQVMGRSARQGDPGSYRMILLDSDLEWILGAQWAEEVPKIMGSNLYQVLNEKRQTRYESLCGGKKLAIDQCKREHQQSKMFMDSLIGGNMESVKNFLIERNRSTDYCSDSSRTILLMDATGSMAGLLSAAKDTVCTTFERTTEILQSQAVATSFQMQFAVYRDYDCGLNGILQVSAWQTNPKILRAFMETIRASGGADEEEAIEIGLWHAKKESKEGEGVSQIILIGDAAAKDQNVVIDYRKHYGGGETQWYSKFGAPTFYKREIEYFKEKNIPIHAFFISKSAEANFRQIATSTGGRCEFLNIMSHEGAELLTNMVTEEVLRKTAGAQGEAAVEAYRNKYSKKSFIN